MLFHQELGRKLQKKKKKAMEEMPAQTMVEEGCEVIQIFISNFHGKDFINNCLISFNLGLVVHV
jgi:hypothetical protein